MAMMSSSIVTVLETSGKHARWWLKVFGSGLKSINIIYNAGKENTSADALSRNPHGQVQVASVQSEDLTLSKMLQLNPVPNPFQLDFGAEQHPELCLTY